MTIVPSMNASRPPKDSNTSKLVLHGSHPNQCALSTRHPSRLNDDKSNKVSQSPIATVRSEHGEVLNLQRTSAILDEKVYLRVVVQQQHSLLRHLFAREVVRLQLDVRRQSDDWWCLRRMTIARIGASTK